MRMWCNADFQPVREHGWRRWRQIQSSKPLPNIPYRLTLDIRLISLLACAALFLSSCATPLDKKDLEAFLSQREICDHLRGEIPDPSDPERLKEVIDDINKYCAGTDQQLKALKARYAKDPEVMATLNAFENRIESKPHQ